jgi:hypothetical protein
MSHWATLIQEYSMAEIIGNVVAAVLSVGILLSFIGLPLVLILDTSKSE